MIKKKWLFWEYEIPKRIPGCVNITSVGWFNKENTDKFLKCAHRYEAIENKHVYIKGIRSALLALGFDEDYVNNELYERALELY